MSDQSGNRFITSLRLYFDIARLRRGPEDVPVDRSLLLYTIIGYVLLNLLLAQLVPGNPGRIMLRLVIDLGMVLLWLAVLLRLAGKPERFLQTATAVFGFQLVAVPLVNAAGALYLRLQEDPTWQTPVLLLLAAVGTWVLVVNTRILMAATQWPVILCVALVLMEALAGGMILLALFPEAGASAPAA